MSTPTAVTVSDVRESVVVTNNGNVTTVVTPPSTTRVTISSVGPQGPGGVLGPPRSVTIAGPQIGDNFTLFRTSGSTTIASVVALVSGGSVTYELRYAADRTTAGTLATISDTVTNTTTGDSATVQNQPIPSGRYVWLNITAVTGTVNEFNLSLAL